jgi:tetratricopeptide (TPR) repeat protein
VLEQALKFYNATISIKKDYYLSNFYKTNYLYSKSEYKKALECYDDSFKILGKKNWEFDIENYNIILNEYKLI